MPLVLVVDDDPDVLQTIELSLSYNGYRVLCAQSGRAALQMAQTECPDAVVLDVMMPEMDGLEVCRQLRAQDQTARVPILFLTANGTVGAKIAGFDAGANDYLVKPFGLPELYARIRALVSRNETESLKGLSTRLVVGALALDSRTFTLMVNNCPVQITPIEFELLYYLMSHANQVLSAELLLRQVWRLPANTGKLELVRAHIKNLRNKIEPDPKNPVYLRTVGHSGYIIDSR